jgi:acyl dehydratase
MIDPSAVPLGARSAPQRTYLDPDQVVAYALAINDENPLYMSGEAVPPVFGAVVSWKAFWELPQVPLEAIGVHGEHDLAILRPMVPGTWLTTVGEISSVVCSATGMIVSITLDSVDDGGEQVLRQHWSLLYRGQAVPRVLGSPPPGHVFPEESRARLHGSMRMLTTRDQTFRYGGASGDRNPMHMDDEVARARGFPRKINQGLCTLAIASRGLIDLAAGGDPRRVRRIAARFSAPAFPGDAIDLAVHDAGPCDQGGWGYAFEAVSGSTTVLRHGRFEVAANE